MELITPAPIDATIVRDRKAIKPCGPWAGAGRRSLESVGSISLQSPRSASRILGLQTRRASLKLI